MSSQTDAPRTDDLELSISGMTCAACANRIERKLNKLEGVVATVNYATEKAKVTYPVGMSSDELLRTVEAAGYSARLPAPPRPAEEAGAGRAEPDHVRALRDRLLDDGADAITA